MFILGIILLSLFGAAFLTGIAFLIVTQTQKKYSAQTTGKVVDKTIHNGAYEKGVQEIADAKINGNQVYLRTGGKTSSGSHSYYLIYEYTVNGILYRNTTGYAVGGLQANKKVGKEVTVSYNPEAPVQASLTKKGTYKALSILLLNLGGVGSLAGIILLLLSIL